MCKVKFDRCILLGVRFNFGVRERRKERRKLPHSVQTTSYTTKSHQSRTMQAVHKTAQRSKWLLLLLSMLLNAVSTGSARRGRGFRQGVGGDYVFQFRICRLHYVLRLSDSFSAAFLVVRALPFLISHCLSLCTALCVFECVCGWTRTCVQRSVNYSEIATQFSCVFISFARSLLV